MSLFAPDQYLSSVKAIDLDDLAARGKRFLLIDLDNTLLPRDRDSVPPDLEAWAKELPLHGFRACFLSNNWHDRVFRAADQLGFELVSKAVKPLPFAYLVGLHRLGAKRNETVMIGDQLFTDIMGGNLLGIETVLVKPLAKKDLAHTLFLRKVEKLFMKDRQPTR